MSPSDAHSPRRLPLPRLRPPTRAQARLATRRLWESAKGALVPPRDDIEARNSYFLRREQVSTAIVGAATSFGSNFAVRLGASNLLVSLLSSGPSLLVVLMTLPTARFLEKRRDRIWWIVNSRFIQRLVFLAIALMPFFARTHQAELFVGLQLFRQLLLAPQSAGWSALIADLVPERKRTSVVAGRHILHAAVTIVATPIVGRLLDQMIFPYGYQVAFALAFVAGMAGMLDLWRLREPDKPEDLPPRPAPQAQRSLSLAMLKGMLGEHRPFAQLVLNTLLLDMGMWLVSPLYIIYYLRHLGASDTWVGALTSVANLSAIVGYYVWQKLIHRWGNSAALKWTAPLIFVLPLIVGVTPSLWPILAASVFVNLVSAGLNLAHFNILLKVCPADRRPTFTSLYSTIMNVGAFILPLVGVQLADLIGIPTMFLIAAGLRLLGGLAFTLWPVRAEEPAPAQP